MADRLLRAQVTIALDSGIPNDAIVNTFHFDQDDNGLLPPPQDSYDAVVASLAGFYQAFDADLFPTHIAGTAVVKIYDMRDPEPRVLRDEQTIVLTPGAGYPLPNQVSLCVSWACTPVSGTPTARLRGRTYLGPVAAAGTEMVNSQMRPTAALRNAVKTGCQSLITPNDVGGSSLSFAIYSPTLDVAGSIDDAFNDVQTGWIDDTFDIQRRRAPEATTRTTF